MCHVLKTRGLLLSGTILAGILSGLALVWQNVFIINTIPSWARLLFLAICIGVAVLEWQEHLGWALIGLFFAIVISVSYIFY